MTEPLRVLLVTTSLEHGGAETQVYLLARSLVERGHTVEVVSMRDPDAYVPELTAAAIPVTSLHMHRKVPDPRALLALARVYRRFRPDVVHSHMVHANLLARLARTLAPIPVQVSSAHNLIEGGRLRDVAYRLTDPLCTLTTNVAHVAVERFVRRGAVPAHKIRFMPNGLDTAPIDSAAGARTDTRTALGVDDAFVWLAVGRLEPQKDYQNLIEALVHLYRGGHGSGTTTLVVGDGPLDTELRLLAKQRGLSDRSLRFLGRRTDVPKLMAAADGFVMSSAWEGLPLVLLEAAAARLPVVATDVGGNGEVVVHEQTGLLVPAREAIRLANAMERVIEQTPDERAVWGERARRVLLERYDLNTVVDTWEACYRELLSRSARGRRHART